MTAIVEVWQRKDGQRELKHSLISAHTVRKTLCRHPAETLAQTKWHAVTAINYIMLTSIFRR